MRTSTIMAHAPEEIKSLLRAAASEVRSDHARMRTTIFDAVVGRQKASCAIPAMNEGPRPMEVDAIMGGEGGKGKKGNSDACRVCGKLGHFAKDCYFRDTGKGKGKPRSKGGGKNFGKGSTNSEKFAGKCNYCQ
jgi:hypothetical protein